MDEEHPTPRTAALRMGRYQRTSERQAREGLEMELGQPDYAPWASLKGLQATSLWGNILGRGGGGTTSEVNEILFILFLPIRLVQKSGECKIEQKDKRTTN